MRKSTLLSLLFAGASLFFLFSSNSNGRATQANTGNTGAPGETTICSGCHSGGSYGTITPTIQVFQQGTTTPVTAYVAGTTYDVRFTVTAGTGSPGGYSFQMTCLTSPANNPLAGYSNLGPNVKQKLVTTGTYMGRTYVEHNGVGSINQFDMSWTAPAAGTGTVKFYAAGNCVNLSGSTSGDKAASTSFTLPESLPLQVSANVTDVQCFGQNTGAIDITVTGGVAPLSYLWNDGITALDRSNLLAGEYTLQITDGTGSATSYTYVVDQASVIQINYTLTQPLCPSDNGSIAYTISGGTAPYSAIVVDVNNQEMNPLALAPTCYQLLVEDAAGCAANVSFCIEAPQTLNINATVDHVSCFGFTDGSIVINPTGGTGTLVVDWELPFEGNTLNDLASGEYALTITDENGCSFEDVIIVSEPTALEVDANLTEILCAGELAVMDVSAIGGTAPYSGLGIFEFEPGNQEIIVTDANGCSINIPFVVTSPEPFIVTGSAEPMACVGGETEIVFTANGGVTPYNSDLSNVPVTTPGDYSFTFIDANGCETETDITVSTLDGLSLSPVIFETSCAGSCDGSIMLDFIDAVGNVDVTWSSGLTGATITEVCAGDYTVTATDESGCTVIGNYTIESPEEITIDVTSPEILCFEGTTSIAINANGGTGTFDYFLNDELQNGNTINGIAAGTYTASVTDENGCTVQVSESIDQPEAITYVVDLFIPIGFGVGTVELTTSGGVEPYTFEWTSGANTEDTMLPENSTHSCTITDANGCSIITEEFEVISHVDDLNFSQVRFFPNPADNQLTLDLSKSSSVFNAFAISNALGEKVVSGKIVRSIEIIDISELPAGVYNLTLQSGKQQISSTLVIR
ncbi:MAG: choice-of-anchor V domain-containing protein [Flavobacteriales bacterium]